MNSDQDEIVKKSKEEIPVDAWMIRSCQIYKEELYDCESQLGRRYQNYVYGQHLDCSQWKKDLENCVKFNYKNDVQAAKELIAVEEARRQHRLGCARANDVWKYRRSPPEDWNAPLGKQKQTAQNQNIQNEATKSEAVQKEADQTENRTREGTIETVTRKSWCAVS